LGFWADVAIIALQPNLLIIIMGAICQNNVGGWLEMVTTVIKLIDELMKA
jgi:hypothetical protein